MYFCFGNNPRHYQIGWLIYGVTTHRNEHKLHCLLLPSRILQWPLLLTLTLTSIPAWMSKGIHYKGWDYITYPFPNFNGTTVEIWEWISNISHIYNSCNYLSMPRLTLIHVNKRGLVEYKTLTHDKQGSSISLLRIGLHVFGLGLLLLTGLKENQHRI